MINLDDMTLEELQQLLTFNKRDSNDVRRIQELSGLTGKDVDGIWGKQTSAAWKKFGEEELSPAIDDEQKFQDAMARGQKSPYVADILGYSNERDKKINTLQSQIEMVKERIARNKRTLLDNKGVTERVANMEFKKFNSSDPSKLFRWREGQKDMKEANEQVKIGTANKYANEVEALLKKSIPTNYAEQDQLLDRVSAKIAEGKTLGLDVSRLKEMEDALAEKVNWSINNDNKVKEVRTKLNDLDLQLKIDGNNTKYKEGIKNLLNEKFDDVDLRLELNRALSLGEKKVDDGKNIHADIDKKNAEIRRKNVGREKAGYDPLPLIPYPK